ncbi:hypothetical protein [Variovorax sp. PBL-E5]|uniref:hypothetical protein n=1 Tax=Variovorax sp. PBL-E5 TaxID=434014 RepID=UPI001316EA36|nr:hypothetical protein [Variovorax sp. PBL-E5]VTU28454.1 hypothetical protein E5CHR_02612 [Variovorax sp. PBL-E5]
MITNIKALEANCVDLLAAVKAAHETYRQKGAEIDELSTRRATLAEASDQHVQANDDLAEAQRMRENELGQALIEQRKPNTAVADEAMKAARGRLDAISAAGIASAAAVRLIDEAMAPLQAQHATLSEAFNDALASYLQAANLLSTARHREASDAVDAATAGMRATAALADMLARTFLTASQRANTPTGHTSMLARYADSIRSVASTLPYDDGIRKHLPDAQEKILAPLRAVGIELS